MDETLTWKNFFDFDLSDPAMRPVLEAFLTEFDVKNNGKMHFRIGLDILVASIKVQPESKVVVVRCFELVEALLSHLKEEDVEDWSLLVQMALERWPRGDVNKQGFQLLTAFSRSHSSMFLDLQPYIEYMAGVLELTAAEDSSLHALQAALPFFVNVLSMNPSGVQVGDESTRSALAAYFTELLRQGCGEVDVVQSACFLLNNVLREQLRHHCTPSKLEAALVDVLTRQREEFGCVRSCLKTFGEYIPAESVLSSRSNAGAFGALFLDIFRLLEENEDGPSLLQLLRLCLALARSSWGRSCAVDLGELGRLLHKYRAQSSGSGADAVEELMLADDDAALFVRLCEDILAEIPLLDGRPELEPPSSASEEIEIVSVAEAERVIASEPRFEESPEDVVSTGNNFLPFSTEDVKEEQDERAVSGARATAPYPEDAPYLRRVNGGVVVGAGGASLEVEEGKLLEMMEMIRHFQDHASESFHRASLLQGLFLESSRKVEELLKEVADLSRANADLHEQVASLRAGRGSGHGGHITAPARGPRGGEHSASEVDSGSHHQNSGLSRGMSTTSSASSALQVLEKESKVLRVVFEAYAGKLGALVDADAATSFARDFGLCPALLSASQLHALLARVVARQAAPASALTFATFLEFLVELSQACDFLGTTTSLTGSELSTSTKSPRSSTIELLIWLDTSGGLKRIAEKDKTRNSVAAFRYTSAYYRKLKK